MICSTCFHADNDHERGGGHCDVTVNEIRWDDDQGKTVIVAHECECKKVT